MDWHELQKMRVSDLRELAKEKTDLEGLSGLHKDELVEKLAQALDIPRPHKVAEGAGKADIKARIRELKTARAQALEGKDAEQLRRVRAELRRHRRKLRRMAHLTH